MAKGCAVRQGHIRDFQLKHMRAGLERDSGDVHEIPGSGQLTGSGRGLRKSSHGTRAVVRHHGPLGGCPNEAVPGHEPLHPFGHEFHLYFEVGTAFGGKELAGGQPDPRDCALGQDGPRSGGKQEDSEQQNPEGHPP